MRIAHGVRQNHVIAVMIEPSKMGPAGRQGTVRAAITAAETRVVKAAILGIRPARSDRVGQLDEPDNTRMGLVLAVEVDPIPVDESVAGPPRGQAKGVVVVDRPRAAPRYSP